MWISFAGDSGPQQTGGRVQGKIESFFERLTREVAAIGGEAEIAVPAPTFEQALGNEGQDAELVRAELGGGSRQKRSERLR